MNAKFYIRPDGDGKLAIMQTENGWKHQEYFPYKIGKDEYETRAGWRMTRAGKASRYTRMLATGQLQEVIVGIDKV